MINPLQPTSANSKTHILEKEELIITPFVLQSTVQFLDQAVIPSIEEEDEELSTFSIKKDKEFRIPMIKQVLNIIFENAVFYTRPWSLPTFMK